MRHAPRLVLVLSAALLLGACAAGGGTRSGPDGFVVPIEVENTLADRAGATIYIVRTGDGVRRLLGPVEAGRKRSFDYDAVTGDHRLVARQGMGPDSTLSEPFRLAPGLRVQWTLGENRLAVGPR